MSQPYHSYEPADPTHTSRGAVGGGSSTGAPGFPTGLRDTRSEYDESKGYNSATGASYSRESAGGPTQTRQRPLSPSPSRSDDRIVGDAPLPHTASTAQRAEIEDSRAARAGEGLGNKVKGIAASVHGAGESLRGAVNTAVDRTFGSNEGAERNQEIANKGAEEIRSGRFTGNR
ncbi:hypothetical protein Pdw03_7917 [Penicillium digitatum]|uniref:Uncharacterized protein n=3 Tax=Penicillium digitatum TaxID=36651 RepID=K9FPS3_PEND2|nr:hypothetical protein PDIP_58390 [Penicillium digitatum Pd1]EKV10799.1 hypothetical protein PDIP_58390 [Penicillium digitatum Pd1]EKV11675.1 hypothetical protein PDIG_49010 [Penicillium digitatum PHI26]KAG0157646.1 hypothetical protein PDIDSM_4831 [Penicillium digitatum]QQK44016.1 hypothetical protein Pdw03_7917 [Penicillium digitatum]